VKAVIESAGKVASRVRIGAHELVFDQPASVPGGEDRGPSPLDVLAISVAACAHYFAAAYLFARGLPTAELAVEVESEKSRLPTPRLGILAVKVRLPAGTEAKHVEGVERAVRACPAYGTLVHPPSVELTFEVADGPAAAAPSERHSA
jgi:uncharacterized OsmC-like protein